MEVCPVYTNCHMSLIKSDFTSLPKLGLVVDVPNYCAEITQTIVRPKSSAVQMLMNTAGISMAYVVGAFLPWRTAVFVFASLTGLYHFLIIGSYPEIIGMGGSGSGPRCGN